MTRIALWLLLVLANGQYDWPLDSCACHIFYEHWVRMQLVISQVFTADFADQALASAAVREALAFDSCRDLRKVENSLAWTVSTAAQTDCAPGQMSSFIMCSQSALLKGDLESARLYSEIANYQLPFAANCMDAAQWTFRPEDVQRNHRTLMRFALQRELAGQEGPLTPEEVRGLLWRFD
ncbi:unnamed protein product [Effrenium voratum]|uniref:Uncharacterized protein n=1 Tax=Effrenium voratum TaxID=2562239 RepID=A0AA36JJU9_9DINO|nr:unnamed protein product [Effrenium voratum]CAJ1443528.1 unnamed protein product [Effrenium voratum]